MAPGISDPETLPEIHPERYRPFCNTDYHDESSDNKRTIKGSCDDTFYYSPCWGNIPVSSGSCYKRVPDGLFLLILWEENDVNCERTG